MIQLVSRIADLFPVGLPQKTRVYCNYIPGNDAPVKQRQQYLEETSDKFSCINRAGSLHHLYTMLGGTIDERYISTLVDTLSSSSSTTDIQNVFIALPADDVVMQERIIKHMKQKTGLSMTALRSILKNLRTLGADDDQEAWDETLNDLINSEYAYFSTGKKDEGYWIKRLDRIDSLHEFNVHFELMDDARDKLLEIQKLGTSMVNELLQQVKERKNFKIEDFEPERDLIHFRNGIYFIQQDYFLPRDTAPDNIPPFVRQYRLRTFSTLLEEYHPEIPLEIPSMTWGNWAGGWYLQEFEHAFEYYFDGDAEVMNRWWEWFGYTLTNYIMFKKAAIYHGESDCGKSKFTEIHQHAIGEQWVEHTFHDICDKRLGISGSLYRKKVCYDDDLGDDRIKDHSEFKRQTGKSTMEVRELYQNPFMGENTVKFLASANVLPPVKNIGIPFCNRWLIFFFKHVIPKDEQDIFFPSRMSCPRVIQYMYRKGIHHLRILLNRGYFVGMNGEEVMHWWQLGSNIVYRFVKECCIEVPTIGESDVQADLYQHFCTFADSTNMKATWVKGQATFTSQLKTFGYPAVPAGHRDRTDDDGITRSTSVKVYRGLAIDQDKLDTLIQQTGKKTAPAKKKAAPTLLQHATTPPAPKPALNRVQKEIEKVYDIITRLEEDRIKNKMDRFVPYGQIKLAADYNDITEEWLQKTLKILTDHLRITGDHDKGFCKIV